MKLLETIRFEKGVFANLNLHQERLNRARWDLFGLKDEIILADILQAWTLEVSEQKVFKCRIIYAEEIQKIEFTPYTIPIINSLKIISDDKIDYQYKYLDRSRLEQLYSQKGNHDDILIVRNGMITDTFYCNILFYDGKDWVTPTHPLLMGTQREFLIKKGIIKTKDITIQNLRRFQKARLINAMIRFEDKLDIEIENISI